MGVPAFLERELTALSYGRLGRVRPPARFKGLDLPRQAVRPVAALSFTPLAKRNAWGAFALSFERSPQRNISMTKILLLPAAGALLLGLAACDPYNPADRAVGGAAIGAGAGAATGAAIGGGPGAAVGAGVGAGVGAATGVLTTPVPPPPPPPRY